MYSQVGLPPSHFSWRNAVVRADLLSKVNNLGIDNNEFEKILDKALAGGEIKDDSLFNTGSFKWERSEWDKVIALL